MTQTLCPNDFRFKPAIEREEHYRKAQVKIYFPGALARINPVFLQNCFEQFFALANAFFLFFTADFALDGNRAAIVKLQHFLAMRLYLHHRRRVVFLRRVVRRDLKNFRAFLHHYERFGREKMTERIGRDSLSYARGYLSFIHMIRPDYAAKLQNAHPWLAKTK
jgi:hypothetical protein